MIRDGPIKIWIISKTGIDPLEIEASSFDEAIRKAREINKEYNTGQLKEIIPWKSIYLEKREQHVMERKHL